MSEPAESSTYRTPGAIGVVPVLEYQAQSPRLRVPVWIYVVGVIGCTISIWRIALCISWLMYSTLNIWTITELILVGVYGTTQYLGAFRRHRPSARIAATLLLTAGIFCGLLVLANLFEAIISPNAQRTIALRDWFDVLILLTVSAVFFYASYANTRWSQILLRAQQ